MVKRKIMIQGVRTQTIVQPGGLIEVRSEELPEGASVEVILILETSSSNETKSKGLSRFLGATQGKGSFASAADIDKYIRQERDSWDS